MRGKWYLVYTYTDELEAGTFRDGITDEEVPLNATTEDQAVVQATAQWNEVSAASQARWEEQKKTWAHPPESPTEWGARNPRVVYKFPLPV